jgi:hypothetical protein
MLIEPHPEAGLRDLFVTEMIGQVQNSGQETCADFAGGFTDFPVKLLAFFDDKHPQRWVLPFQQKRGGRPSNRSSNYHKVVGRLHADTKIRFCARLFKTYPSSSRQAAAGRDRSRRCRAYHRQVRAFDWRLSSMSRRDDVKVAWHEVPGKHQIGVPSRRDGMIQCLRHRLRRCRLSVLNPFFQAKFI